MPCDLQGLHIGSHQGKEKIFRFRTSCCSRLSCLQVTLALVYKGRGATIENVESEIYIISGGVLYL